MITPDHTQLQRRKWFLSEWLTSTAHTMSLARLYMLLSLPLVPFAATATQTPMNTSVGNRPFEVRWSMVCSGGSLQDGGSPFSGSSNATNGENCTLHMKDATGDGWNGAHWTGFGQNLTLTSGQNQTSRFVVPLVLSADRPSAFQPGCVDTDDYNLLQPRLYKFPLIKTCAAAAEHGLCSKVASVCPASCGACEGPLPNSAVVR